MFVTVLKKHFICPCLEPNESVHALQSYFCKIYCNIILPSKSRSSKFSLSFCFVDQTPTPICILSHACHMHRPCYSPDLVPQGTSTISFETSSDPPLASLVYYYGDMWHSWGSEKYICIIFIEKSLEI